MSTIFSNAPPKMSAEDKLTRRLYCFHVRQWELRRGKTSDYGNRRMAVWDGGRDRSGAMHRPIWPRLNSHIRANSLDVFRYLSISFKTFSTDRHPTPRQLIGPTALARYAECSDPVKTLQLKLQVALVEVPVIVERAVYLTNVVKRPVADSRRAALIGAVSLPALFRRSLAMCWGDKQYADSLMEAAFDEFLYDPSGYMEAWGSRYIDGAVYDLFLKEIRRTEADDGYREEEVYEDDSGTEGTRFFGG